MVNACAASPCNDPTTTFADMQSLFSEALRRMDDPAWLAAHGFSAKQILRTPGPIPTYRIVSTGPLTNRFRT
jgi:hypothetical protein